VKRDSLSPGKVRMNRRKQEDENSDIPWNTEPDRTRKSRTLRDYARIFIGLWMGILIYNSEKKQEKWK
jgi:hypothetical protein